MNHISLVVISSILFAYACGGTSKASKLSSRERLTKDKQVLATKASRLDQLAYMIEGSFSSTEQHLQDPKSHYDVTLNVYRIWGNQRDGYWFYSESALTKMQDKPYRQRIYRIYEYAKDTVVSETYVIPKEKEPLFVGAWKALFRNDIKNPFEKLSPSQLTIKDGCQVYLFKVNEERFEGSTRSNTCQTTSRKDSKYTISNATIMLNKQVTWDRGVNEKGEQIWGAEDEGYTFLRLPKEAISDMIKTNPPSMLTK